MHGLGGNTFTDNTWNGGRVGFLHTTATTDTVTRSTIQLAETAASVEAGTLNIDNSVIDLGSTGQTGLRAGTDNSVGATTVDARQLTVVGGAAGSRGVWAYAAAPAATSSVTLANSIVRGPTALPGGLREQRRHGDRRRAPLRLPDRGRGRRRRRQPGRRQPRRRPRLHRCRGRRLLAPLRLARRGQGRQQRRHAVGPGRQRPRLRRGQQRLAGPRHGRLRAGRRDATEDRHHRRPFRTDQRQHPGLHLPQRRRRDLPVPARRLRRSSRAAARSRRLPWPTARTPSPSGARIRSSTSRAARRPAASPSTRSRRTPGSPRRRPSASTSRR